MFRHHNRHPVRTQAFLKNLFKLDPAEATRKKYQARVDAINALEPKMQALSDEELRAKTEEYKKRAQNGETLESLLVEAFAVGLGRAWAMHPVTQEHYISEATSRLTSRGVTAVKPQLHKLTRRQHEANVRGGLRQASCRVLL